MVVCGRIHKRYYEITKRRKKVEIKEVYDAVKIAREAWVAAAKAVNVADEALRTTWDAMASASWAAWEAVDDDAVRKAEAVAKAKETQNAWVVATEVATKADEAFQTAWDAFQAAVEAAGEIELAEAK